MISQPPDSITILRAYRRLAKQVHSDGTIEDFDHAKTFDMVEQKVGNVEELAELLRQLERREQYCVVRAAIVDSARRRRVRRLCHPDIETGEEATLTSVPRRWVALDFDNLPRPDWMAPEDLSGCGCIASATLPVAFQSARAVVQATASHGLKPGIRVRLWYWFDRPTTAAELKAWLRDAPVDHSVLGAAQITYTARPVFCVGAFDPLPERLAMLPGAPEVSAPAAESLMPARPPRQRPRIGLHRSDFNGLLQFVAEAPEGERNSRLYWSACRFAEHIERDEVGYSSAREMLEDAAADIGLPASVIAATIRSGLRQGGAA